MAIELSKLMEKVSYMDITLLAGKKGLSNVVSWVHMVETKEASSFLNGGEVAFTTGIGLNNGLSLLTLVQTIYEHGAAGIFLNTGPFLNCVTKDVIDFCDANNFPVFSVPWKIHIAEIIRIFSYAISKSEQIQFEISAAFKNAILFPKQEELYLVPLSQHGFQAGWRYYVGSIQIVSNSEQIISEYQLQNLCTNIENYLQHHAYKHFAIFCNDSKLILITGDYTAEKLHEFIDNIMNYLNLFLPENETFFIGIGKCTNSIRCLHKSYRHSLSILKLLYNKQKNASVSYYSDIGIYQLLLGIEDNDIIQDYCKNTISSLIEYDKKNDSDLAYVLWCYLKHDGSVKQTAEALFVHRNTVNYKLNRASEILGKNLSSLDTRLQLTLGFMLYEMKP